MITFLLNSGFSLPVVTISRLLSSGFEVSATAVMPWGVKTLRNRPVRYRTRTNETEEQVGFLENEQIPPEGANIDKAEIPAVYGIAGLTTTPSEPSGTGLPNPYFSIPLLLGVSLSRIGLWTYDLAYSQLQQTLPPPALRGEFMGIEQSFVSAAELLQWSLTAIMSRPEDFGTLTGISWIAVLGAAGCYAWFIRKRRGHLLHIHASACCKN
ncbi:hypothetical protein DRE_06800 [Drechslerella stenobrocha 248]|uniref:Solute carrier family 40 member n=1 Tax=Drechslerella stenobrocha 248 TaxID=1043628 RepID=W7HWH8_9PEZI|nr:hypothetical protein DRE_06800 [Drechslerella stenobrocha 248]